MIDGVLANVAPATTPGGSLLVLALMLPVVGVVLSMLLGGRHAARIALAIASMALVVAVAILVALVRSDAAVTYLVGAWIPPLGIALRADGLSAAMMLTTAMMMGATIVFARGDFLATPGAGEERAPFLFWPLLLGVWAGLNGIFLGNDLFSIYVALELLTFAAVPLVCLDGRAETLAAALRYLLFALIGSLLYLLGAGLLYGAYGTLDITLLAERIGPDPSALAAIALMTVGLMAKTALFPLHLWLPPAHAGAPSAASAILSALVVKGSFFVVVRLWFDVMPELLHQMAAQLVAALGAGAILFGSVLALRQTRLKMLIAYSTVAQIGYLFLMFPLATTPDIALTGGMLQAISHAFAKGAMFMAAGLIAEAAGHDRIADLGGIGRALPMTVIGFAIGGLSLMGVPPSGGFWAKWLLLSAAITTGQWWWALVMLAGGLLAAGYVFRALSSAVARAGRPAKPFTPVSRVREAVVLGLALCSLLLGLLALAPLDVVQIGQPGAFDATETPRVRPREERAHALPSPACGRRWPEGPDEGAVATCGLPQTRRDVSLTPGYALPSPACGRGEGARRVQALDDDPTGVHRSTFAGVVS